MAPTAYGSHSHGDRAAVTPTATIVIPAPAVAAATMNGSRTFAIP